MPAPSAFPQQTRPALCPGINLVPPSPAPAPTTMTVASTELTAAVTVCSTHIEPSIQYCAVPILDLFCVLSVTFGVSTGILSSSVCSMLLWKVAVPNTVYWWTWWYVGAFPAQFCIWCKLHCTSDTIKKHLVPFQYMYSTVKLHCREKLKRIHTHRSLRLAS